MVSRRSKSLWTKSFQRAVSSLTRQTVRASTKALRRSLKPASTIRARRPAVSGDWTSGIALGTGGARHYKLFKPPHPISGERFPLLVMLHGCGQDAASFATSTRMNRLASTERFCVLYPEQDRISNSQGCWNWFETQSGRAFSEVSTLLAAVDQICALYPIDRSRIAVAGISAGASMAALMVSRAPGRFKAVVMHSGVPPGAAHSTLSALGAMRGRPAHFDPQLSSATSAAMSGTSFKPASGGEWPPLLVIQGAADRVVDPSNGTLAARYWAQHTGALVGGARVSKRGNRYRATLTDFKAHGRVTVTLCEVDTLGHAWSGGNSLHPFGDDRGPDASRMVWSFAQRQFNAAAAQP